MPLSHWRELLEIVVAFTSIMLALWTTGATQKFLISAAFLWIVLCAFRTWQNAGEWGLSLAGLGASAWVVLAAMVLAGALVLAASELHTLHVVAHGFAPLLSVTAYVLWALLQEFILVNVFLFRLLRILPNRISAVLLTAALFAVAHVPNPVLFTVTLLWGIVASLLFMRYRNLYTLAFAHAIVGLTLAITVPDTVQHQMRVGIGYLHWHPPVISGLVKPQ